MSTTLQCNLYEKAREITDSNMAPGGANADGNRRVTSCSNCRPAAAARWRRDTPRAENAACDSWVKGLRG